MTELKKHSTARPVVCKDCKGEFSALWGETVIHALGGYGLCDGCKKKAERASKVTKPLPSAKREKVEVDDGAKAGPVQDKSD